MLYIARQTEWKRFGNRRGPPDWLWWVYQKSIILMGTKGTKRHRYLIKIPSWHTVYWQGNLYLTATSYVFWGYTGLLSFRNAVWRLVSFVACSEAIINVFGEYISSIWHTKTACNIKATRCRSRRLERLQATNAEIAGLHPALTLAAVPVT